MKETKLVYEDHVKMGKQLKQMREDLLKIMLSLSKSEGSASSTARTAKRALGEIDHLRVCLDSCLCASLPPTDDSWKGVYYGPR